MTHALTRRLLRRKKAAPDYLPPPLLHRFEVWGYCINPLSVAVVTLLFGLVEGWTGVDSLWPGLAFLIVIILFGHQIPHRIRARYATRESMRVGEMLARSWTDAQLPEPDGDDLQRFDLFVSTLHVYVRDCSRHTFSVHPTPWDGEGFKYTAYERGRSKLEFTFHGSVS